MVNFGSIVFPMQEHSVILCVDETLAAHSLQ